MSNSINYHDEDIEKYEFKPNKFQLCLKFIYNSDNKTIIGRTGCSWMKIGLFFLIFYASLAAFFISMMTVFLKGVVNSDIPARTGYDNLLNLEPGLSMKPLPDYSGTLIRFTPFEPQTYLPYVMDMKAFLQRYEELKILQNSNEFANCSGNEKVPEDVEKPCLFNLNMLQNCNAKNNFGYPEGKPCILLKLNKIFGWIPDPLDNQTSVLVKCEGQNHADKVNIGNPVYYPSYDGFTEKMGVFDHNYYPFLGQESYTQPLVAVQFPNAKKRAVVLIKCTLQNVKYTSNNLLFELLINDFDRSQ